jgi:predicted permease
MGLWHGLRARVQPLIFRSRSERAMDEELRLHVELETERLERTGLSRRAARRQALRDFGGLEQIKEMCRDVRGTASVDAVRRDVRHGARRLLRDWRFTVAAVTILGVGIGATTAIFSLVNALLFRPPGVIEPERIVNIYQNREAALGGGVGANSYPAYLDMAAYTNVFSSVAAASIPDAASFRDGTGGLRPAVVEYATPTYLATLGLRPALGRWFDASDDTAGAPALAVVNHRTWVTKFNADPSVIGRTIRMQGAPVTIVGVGPEGYSGTIPIGLVTDFWLPVSAIRALGGPPRALERRPGERFFLVKARLRTGVTVAQAAAAMDALGRRLAADYPQEDPGNGIRVFQSSDVRFHPEMDTALKPLAAVALGAAGLVLAIACSNLATMLLVRGAARAKEVSVRLAVGAARAALVGHLLAESLLLSVAGGVVGCLMAWWAIRLLDALSLPITLDLALDLRVLLFALVLSLATGVLFGLAPAVRATSVDLLSSLRDDGEARSADHRWFTLKNGLVVMQVAVSVLLLAGTSVNLQMMDVARGQQTGFAVNGVAVLQTDARYAGYSAAAARTLADRLQQRVAAIPGVQATALSVGEPMASTGFGIVAEGGDAAPVPAGGIWAGPGFFETMQVRLLSGRAFDRRDRTDTRRVAVVNESLARRSFGTANPIGRRFRFDADESSWHEVIGVVRDTKTADMGGDLVDPQPYLFYRSYTQVERPPTYLVARSSLGAAGLVGAMQRELRALDLAVPVVSAETMAQSLERSLLPARIAARFLGVLGALGLGLAGIGLYAVIAFAVSRRSREIGVRVALGAAGHQVVWAVTRDVAVLVGVGTGAGIALSLLLILALRGAGSPAPGLSIYRPDVDPVAFATIAAFIAVVGVLAACGPARRAARLEPLLALRRD